MLNFRQVNKKIYLSGGWTNIEKDPEFLVAHNIRSVIDIQWTPVDEATPIEWVRDSLEEVNIEYNSFRLWDGEFNTDSVGILTLVASHIKYAIDEYSDKKDRILIKCGAGLSRSVVAYLWYLCVYERLSFPEAYDKFITEHGEQNPYFEGSPHAINDYFWNLLKKQFPDTREIENEST